jgi:hypothetical protein
VAWRAQTHTVAGIPVYHYNEARSGEPLYAHPTVEPAAPDAKPFQFCDCDDCEQKAIAAPAPDATVEEVMALANAAVEARSMEELAERNVALRAAIERVIAQKDNWKHEAIEYANKSDYWRERAKATEVGCEKYLKEGETPAERIERDHLDSLALMGLLAKEKIRAERAEAERGACHLELSRISNALGTNEGHSSVDHIEALKALLVEAQRYVGMVRSSDIAGDDPIFALLDRIDAAMKEGK